MTETKTYRFAIVDAPGYCDNRARVRSRHNTLAAARRALKRHCVFIPGSGRKLAALIVERDTAPDTDYVYWSGIRDAGYRTYGLE